MKTEKKQVQRKVFTGTVVSTKMNKTVKVQVDRSYQHPIYKKSIRRSSTYAAHNEIADIKEGDTVKIASIRPMSKTKFFEVLEKITI